MTFHTILILFRLQSELMTMMLTPTPGISAFPDDGNMLSWTATITGPTETPYSGLNLKLGFAFPSNYPYAPPAVLFKTPIYHPNVDFSGRICLDILKDKWSAVYNVQSVLLSLQSLLGEPNKLVFQDAYHLRSLSMLIQFIVHHHSMAKRRPSMRKIQRNTRERCLLDIRTSMTRAARASIKVMSS